MSTSLTVVENYSPFDIARQFVPGDDVITPAEIETMLIGLLRCPSLRTKACRQLRADYFDAYRESHYALLWSVTQDLLTRYNSVSYEALTAMLVARLTILRALGRML